MMWLKLNSHACEIHFRLRGYRWMEDTDWDNWCLVDLHVTSLSGVNYGLYDDPALECVEVTELEERVDATLRGEGVSGEIMEMIEPYMTFEFCPRKEFVKGNPQRIIYWRIILWDEGPTEDYISMCLDSEAIEYLSLYLKYARNALKQSDPENCGNDRQGDYVWAVGR